MGLLLDVGLTIKKLGLLIYAILYYRLKYLCPARWTFGLARPVWPPQFVGPAWPTGHPAHVQGVFLQSVFLSCLTSCCTTHVFDDDSDGQLFHHLILHCVVGMFVSSTKLSISCQLSHTWVIYPTSEKRLLEIVICFEFCPLYAVMALILHC